MKPITICLTYFKSLSLANLSAALYSVLRQDLSQVEEIVIVDNNTDDGESTVRYAVNYLLGLIPLVKFMVPVRVLSFKHGDDQKTHTWSANVAVREARTQWVLFTRADYLLDPTLLKKFSELMADGRFVTSNMMHLNVDVAGCEQTEWRRNVKMLQTLPGAIVDYTHIDAGVWMLDRASFDKVGGLDETLSAWGHAQTHFQYKLHRAGVRFVRIPEVMFYHPQHVAPRDMALAHQQLRDLDIDIHDLWARYEGAKPY